MLKWEKAKFTVKLKPDEVPNEKTVVGRKSGKFAVHKSVGARDWTITHIPTGLKLTDRGTRDDCVHLVETLSRKIYGFTYMSRERLAQNSQRISEVITQNVTAD